jgi:hypothetical protein
MGHGWAMSKNKTAYSRKPLILLVPELRITKLIIAVDFASYYLG